MDNVEAPPMATTSSAFFTPLLISLMGILFTSLVILSYHLIVRSYRRRQALAAAVALLQPVPQAGLVVTGVDEKVLETIPIIPYSSQNCGLFCLDQSECAVCIGELEDGEMVRVLPNCKHAFHVVCIDQWFMGHASCPVCRSPVVPLTTPCVDERNITVEVSPDQNHDHTCDENGPRNARPCALLRHCVSLVLPMEKKQRRLLTRLKRSLSVDQTCTIIDMERDCARDLSSSSLSSLSSSSSKENLTRSKSISQFDSASLKLWKSFSRLSVRRQRSGILPY